MRALDERPGPLPQRAAAQVGGAVLGHHVVHVGAARHDARALRERVHDARHRAVLRGRGQRDDRPAAPRARRAADEVDLASEARVDRAAHRVGAHLAGEVHRDRRVDRDHAVVLGDHERVVDVVARVELDERVVVEEAEGPLRAEHERRDDLAPCAASSPRR